MKRDQKDPRKQFFRNLFKNLKLTSFWSLLSNSKNEDNVIYDPTEADRKFRNLKEKYSNSPKLYETHIQKDFSSDEMKACSN